MNKMFEYANLKTYSNISQSDIANDSKIIYVTVPSGVVVIMSLIFAIAPFCINGFWCISNFCFSAMLLICPTLFMVHTSHVAK